MEALQVMTRINPDHKSFRVHVNGNNTLKLETFGGQVEVFGSIIDRLGKYESLCLSPEEMYTALKESGKLPRRAEEIRRERAL